MEALGSPKYLATTADSRVFTENVVTIHYNIPPLQINSVIIAFIQGNNPTAAAFQL
jgi:hypothetical protein